MGGGSEVKLSLKLRKNLRDNTEKLNDNLGRIERATGIKFHFEVNFGELLHDLQGHERYEDFAERFGDVVYDSYLSDFAYNVERFASTELLKEHFVKVLSAKSTLGFRVLPLGTKLEGKSTYSRTKVEDGVLYLDVPFDRMWSNTSELGTDLIDSLNDAGEEKSALSLEQQRNINESKAKLEEHLKEIEGYCGIKFDVEVDFAAIAAILPSDCSYIERLGDVVYDYYMGGISWNFRHQMQDDMVKEATVDAFGDKHTIKFEVYEDTAREGGYNKTVLGPNNELLIRIPAHNFAVNVDHVGQGLENIL